MRWCWTLNNPGDFRPAFNEISMSTLCYQLECGASESDDSGDLVPGTEHLQGYVVFKKRVRMPHLKEWLPKAHFELCRGTHAQNVAYCSKDKTRVDGTKPFQFGSWQVGMGRRTDLEVLHKRLVAGEAADVVIVDSHVGGRYYGMCHEVARIVAKRAAFEKRNVTVFVFEGEAGSGKTTAALKLAPEAYIVDLDNKGGGVWMDGYEGESTIILDDFDSGYLPFRKLLKMLEGYRQRMAVKGSFTYARWTKMIITTNVPMRKWYPNDAVWGTESWRALLRRIDEHWYFRKGGKVRLDVGADANPGLELPGLSCAPGFCPGGVRLKRQGCMIFDGPNFKKFRTLEAAETLCTFSTDSDEAGPSSPLPGGTGYNDAWETEVAAKEDYEEFLGL